MRTKNVMNRLIAQMNELSKKDSSLKFYERLDNSFLDLKPESINTAGYWKMQNRMVIVNSKPVAYVVSGRGGSLHLTRFIAAFDISQTEEIKKAS